MNQSSHPGSSSATLLLAPMSVSQPSAYSPTGISTTPGQVTTTL